MPVTYPLTLPAAPNFSSARFALSSNVTVFESPLTKTEQVLERDGARWSGTFNLPPMLRSQASAWTAFFASLRGRVGTFWAHDPTANTPRGSAGGAPTVKTAGQTGNSLITTGWPVSTTGVLLAGDYIEIFDPATSASRFHMVVESAGSDVNGDATLAIEPHLREAPPTTATIVSTNPRVKMRLLQNDVGWDEDTAQFYGFSFAAREAL